MAPKAACPVPVQKGVPMKTQIELAREGIVTEQMQAVASDEKVAPVAMRKEKTRWGWCFIS